MNYYQVTVLYRTASGNASGASFDVLAASYESAIASAQAALRNDKRRRVGSIDGGDVVELPS